MNTKLYNFLKENQQVLVGGLEGSGKSRDVLDTLINSDLVDYRKEYVIYATTSYELLAEKQSELISYQGLTKEECPILTFTKYENLEEKNKKYFDYETDYIYTKKAKIILMTLSAVQRCKHINIRPKSSEDIKSFAMLVVDEFDFTSGIIPRLDYMISSILSGSRSKKTIKDFIRSEYSQFDYEKYERNMITGKSQYLVADYIKRNELFKIPTIFISSEKIPEYILGSIGFNIFPMDDKIFNTHTIYYKADLVNRYTFNRLNDGNKWGIFGFDTIIADRYNPVFSLKHEIEVINHIKCRGSNTFNCNNPLLSIISHVPDSVISNITEALNFFDEGIDKKGMDEKIYKFEDIKAIYYRDRLFQAVGRVIGHRGEKNGNDETWVLISSSIMQSINKSIQIKKIEMPYNLKEWNIENKEWKIIVDAVKSDARIIDKNKTNKYKEKTTKNKLYARELIDKYIEIGNEKDYILLSDIKTFFSNNGVSRITAKFVANHFAKPIKHKRINYKRNKAIFGIRFKNEYKHLINLKQYDS